MLTQIRQRVKSLAQWPALQVVRQEYEDQKPKRPNERPVEFAYVFDAIRKFAPQSILDVGTGKTSLPHLMRICGPNVTAIDNVRDYWPTGMVNRHWHVLDEDIKAPSITETFDMVTCISVLEHIEPADDAVRSMFRLLKPGGALVLTAPYHESSYVRNVYELPGSIYGQGNPYITQSYGRADVCRWLDENHASLVDQQYWRFFEGQFWTQGKQITPPIASSANEPHQHSCLVMRKGS